MAPVAAALRAVVPTLLLSLLLIGYLPSHGAALNPEARGATRGSAEVWPDGSTALQTEKEPPGDFSGAGSAVLALTPGGDLEVAERHLARGPLLRREPPAWVAATVPVPEPASAPMGLDEPADAPPFDAAGGLEGTFQDHKAVPALAAAPSLQEGGLGGEVIWTLVARQRSGKAFPPRTKETFVNDPENPDSGAYMIVGQLNAGDFKDSAGKFHFKLVYDDTTLVWTQTSWLSETIPKNVKPIQPANMLKESRYWCMKFRGLVKSDQRETVFSSHRKCYWNSVGTIKLKNDGIPGWDGKVAGSMDLYIAKTAAASKHKEDGSGSEGTWRLVARQRFNKAFPSAAKESLVNTPDDENSGAYMILGQLSPDEFKDSDGSFRFKLLYDTTELVWTQTSWLSQTEAQGVKGVHPADLLLSGGSCKRFAGLAKSPQSEAILTGSSNRTCLWECVGAISFVQNGIPGWNGKIAKGMDLYIYKPAAAADTSTESEEKKSEEKNAEKKEDKKNAEKKEEEEKTEDKKNEDKKNEEKNEGSKEPKATAAAKEKEKDEKIKAVAASSKAEEKKKEMNAKAKAASGKEKEGVKPKAKDLFDCNEDSGDGKFGWSFAKAEWCCKHKRIGCVEKADGAKHGHGARPRQSWQPGEGPSGETACEEQDWSRTACLSIGCCYFDTQTGYCYSAVGAQPCGSATQAAAAAVANPPSTAPVQPEAAALAPAPPPTMVEPPPSADQELAEEDEGGG